MHNCPALLPPGLLGRSVFPAAWLQWPCGRHSWVLLLEASCHVIFPRPLILRFCLFIVSTHASRQNIAQLTEVCFDSCSCWIMFFVIHPCTTSKWIWEFQGWWDCCSQTTNSCGWNIPVGACPFLSFYDISTASHYVDHLLCTVSYHPDNLDMIFDLLWVYSLAATLKLHPCYIKYLSIICCNWGNLKVIFHRSPIWFGATLLSMCPCKQTHVNNFQLELHKFVLKESMTLCITKLSSEWWMLSPMYSNT